MAGNAFTLTCTLRKDGIAIQVKALGDTGASGYVFLDSKFASDLCHTFKLKPKQLPQTIYPKGFNGKKGSPITHYLSFNIEIDGRRICDLPMLIVKLSSHDMIIGRNFFDYFRVLIDVHHRRLQWPQEFPPAKTYSRTVATYSRDELLPQQVQPQYQQDMFRRDRAIARDDKRRKDGVQIKVLTHELAVTLAELELDQSQDNSTLLPPPRHCASTTKAANHVKVILPQTKGNTWERKNQRDLACMECELSRPDNYQPTSRTTRKTPIASKTAQTKSPAMIDIGMVSANGFQLKMRQPDVEVFSISLDGLDRMIEDQRQELEASPDPDLEDSLRDQVPEAYHYLLDFWSKRESDILPPHQEVDHKIELTEANTLGFSHLNRHSLEELVAMREYLASNLAKGFIELSKSPFASPVLFARKGDGSLRFCVDYRKLNALTKKNRYPLPLIDETLARLSRAKIFTKLDIRQAFHRIRISPDSEELTAFRTRYGLFQYRVMPFGLTNGPATFQSHINDALRDLLDITCTAYLDDILIYSEDELQHETHVKQVIERLNKAGLQADIKKCEFGVKQTKYLGFIVGTDGIQVDPDKVRVIEDWHYPRTVKGVQSFLGFCNFYRRFIRDYSRIAAPLTQLTRTEHAFSFDDKCIQAFETLRSMLIKAPLLAHYDVDSQCLLETDASDTIVAAVFSQKGLDDEWHPVGYFSKTMAPAETNYPIYDKELLAIIKALQHWRAELEGTKDHVEVITDHKALEYFMTSKSLSARQARWAEILSRYHFRISYKPGKTNKADPLTRIEDQVRDLDQAKRDNREQILLPSQYLDSRILQELEVNHMTLSLSPIEDQLDLIDDILKANRTASELSRARKLGQQNKAGYSLEDGLLKKHGRLVVAKPVRTDLITASHSTLATAHPGKGKTRKLIKERYYWLGMDADIDQFVSNCHACRRSKVPRDKTPGLLRPLPVPDRPWQHISMDFKDMPPDQNGMNMVCVFVDRLGKRPISVPCNKSVDARVMAQLYMIHVHKYYGPATTIVSDRGPQFISAFWDEFCRLLGTRLKLSTPYHPQTDGQTENANQWIDQRLRPFVNTFQDNWSTLIHAVDYAAASLPHDSTGMSPFMVELGYQPRMGIDWERPADEVPVSEHIRKAREDAQDHLKRIHKVWEWCRAAMTKAQEKQQVQANKHRRPVDFGEKDKVWVSTKNWTSERPSRKLGYQNEGPYKVTEKVGHSYRLKLPDSNYRHDVFAPDLLRKDPGNPLPGQHPDPPLPIVYNQEPEWEVEELLQSRTWRRKLQYQVKWVGIDHDPEFYDAEGFKGAPHKLKAFHDNHPKAKGPPLNLQYWIDCYLQDNEPEARADDNGYAARL